MLTKNLIATAAVAGLMAFPAPKAEANDALFGAAALGIGALIYNDQRRRNGQVRTQRSGISSAQRQQNMEVQRALNHFNYPVGGVDGALGRRSRAAIANYERDMGFTADGYLDDYERNFLTGSYARAQQAQYGGPDAQILSQRGTRGLLQHYNQARLGVGTNNGVTGGYGTQNAGNGYGGNGVTGNNGVAGWANNGNGNVNTGVAPTQPQVAGGATAGGALPNFQPAPAAKSMEGLCQTTNLLTVANGTTMDANNITNAGQALNEQFCLARDFTTRSGQQQASTIGGVTPDQILAQCRGLADLMKPTLATVSTTGPAQVIASATQAVTGAGSSPAALAQTNEICLGSGYTADDPEIAASSAILLVAAGQSPYGEIVGHQLREGFGFAANPTLAKEWYNMALDAQANGTPPTILPGQAAGRNAVIRAALGQGGIQAGLSAPQPGQQPAQTFVLQPLGNN
ncbi:MAG: peptidoglycan-binding domain-containing protein [Pseudomonadota bacterium]